jgi:hypothetical protein
MGSASSRSTYKRAKARTDVFVSDAKSSTKRANSPFRLPERHFPVRAVRLVVADNPVATDRLDREMMLECYSEGTEALAGTASEANRRLRVAVTLATLAGLERFNASLAQCVHVGSDPGI